MDPQRAVLILTTGGTLEKVHDWRTEGLALKPAGVSTLTELLDDARCYHADVMQVLSKDSLDFTQADRLAILNAVRGAQEEAIVITHGTGTMQHTALFLAEHITNKTVVLSGSMRPFAFGRSDASFNIGGAVIAAQTLAHGIYGVMNGRVFPASALQKNTELGRFDV